MKVVFVIRFIDETYESYNHVYYLQAGNSEHWVSDPLRALHYESYEDAAEVVTALLPYKKILCIEKYLSLE